MCNSILMRCSVCEESMRNVLYCQTSYIKLHDDESTPALLRVRCPSHGMTSAPRDKDAGASPVESNHCERGTPRAFLGDAPRAPGRTQHSHASLTLPVSSPFILSFVSSRLLQADDESTVMSTLVLVYNCLHDSPTRRSVSPQLLLHSELDD